MPILPLRSPRFCGGLRAIHSTCVKTGVAGEIDTTSFSDPVVGLIFGEQGLMANLSLEGAKITKIDKS